jgi:hypothetical protein
MTWAVGSAGGSGATITISVAGFSFDTHWTCTSGGVASYDFHLGASDFGADVTLDVTDTSGTWLPPAEELTPGASWSNSYTTHVTSAAGGVSIDFTSVTNDSFSVVGAETISVPAGTFDAVRVDSTGTTTTSGSIPIPIAPTSTQFSYWFAEGVGIVRYTYSGEGFSGGGDLTGYSVP